MKNIFLTIVACMSLSEVGMDTLESLDLTELRETGQSKEMGIEKDCGRGPRGHRGHRGHRGKRGRGGLQGPSGTARITEFGEAYLIVPGQIAVPQGTSAPVQFTEAGPLSTNITYDPATWTFTIHTAGTYTIEYGGRASTTTADGNRIGTMTLRVLINSVPDGLTDVPGIAIFDGSVFSSFSDPSNQITRNLAAGTTISLSVVASSLQPLPVAFLPIWGLGLSGEQVAYISVKKIG